MPDSLARNARAPRSRVASLSCAVPNWRVQTSVPPASYLRTNASGTPVLAARQRAFGVPGHVDARGVHRDAVGRDHDCSAVPNCRVHSSLPSGSYLRTNASWPPALVWPGSVPEVTPDHVDARGVHGDAAGLIRAGGAELAGPEFVPGGVVLAHERIDVARRRSGPAGTGRRCPGHVDVAVRVHGPADASGPRRSCRTGGAIRCRPGQLGTVRSSSSSRRKRGERSLMVRPPERDARGTAEMLAIPHVAPSRARNMSGGGHFFSGGSPAMAA